jgi:hypothetical protein
MVLFVGRAVRQIGHGPIYGSSSGLGNLEIAMALTTRLWLLGIGGLATFHHLDAVHREEHHPSAQDYGRDYHQRAKPRRRPWPWP